MEKLGVGKGMGLLLLVLFWGAVAASYFSLHPTALLFPIVLAKPLLRILFLLFLSLLLSYCAAPLVAKLEFQLDEGTMLISCGLGWSLFLWFIHLCLYAGFRNPYVPFVLLLVLAAVGRKVTRFSFNKWGEGFSCSGWTNIALAFVALLFFIIATRSQTPPVGPDSLIYHINEPAHIAAGGDYLATFAYPFWGYLHDFYVVAIKGGSDILAKSTPFVFTILSAMVLLLLFRTFSQEGDFGWQLLPVVFYLSFPSVLFIAGTAYLEPVLAYYCLLAILIAVQQDFLDSWKKGLLFAFFLVNAVAVKQTALLFAAPMGLLWFIFSIRRKIKETVIVAMAAIVLFSFHPRSMTTCLQMKSPIGAFKTLITRLNLAGDSYRRPPFPGYVKLFNIEHMRYKPPVMQKVPPPFDAITLLWFISTAKDYPAEFLGNRSSPLFLIALPLIVLAWKGFCGKRRLLVLLLALSFLAWYGGGTYWLRFFTPLLPLIALLTTLALQAIADEKQRFFSMTFLSVIVCAIVGAELMLFIYVAPFRVVLGLEGKDQFLDRRLPHISPMTKYLKALHEKKELGKYLVLGNSQDYYYPGEYIAEGNNLEVVLSLSTAFQDDEKAFISYLRKDGVKHVLVDGFGMHFWLLDGKRFGAFAKLCEAGKRAQALIERAVARRELELVHEEKYQIYSSKLYRVKSR